MGSASFFNITSGACCQCGTMKSIVYYCSSCNDPKRPYEIFAVSSAAAHTQVGPALLVTGQSQYLCYGLFHIPLQVSKHLPQSLPASVQSSCHSERLKRFSPLSESTTAVPSNTHDAFSAFFFEPTLSPPAERRGSGACRSQQQSELRVEPAFNSNGALLNNNNILDSKNGATAVEANGVKSVQTVRRVRRESEGSPLCNVGGSGPSASLDGLASVSRTSRRTGRGGGGPSSAAGSRRQPPPDGGWGWMVVAASFGVNLISDGVSLSFGLFLPDLTAHFGVGRAHAAWVASLFLSMPLLAGPVASWLTDRFGCRRVCVAGSLLAAAGFALSSWSQSLALLYVTFSLAGFGLALCLVTSVVVIAYYFERRRCLATGLSVCGTGLGTFIFAPLTYHLVERFTWRGTLLVLAGFFLNMIASGALMRDLAVEPPNADASVSASESNADRLRLAAAAAVASEHNTGGISLSTCGYLYALNGGGDGAGGVSTASALQTQPRHQQDSQQQRHQLINERQRLCSSLLQLPTFFSKGSPDLPVQVLSEMSTKEKSHLGVLLLKYPNLWRNVLTSHDDPYFTVRSTPLIETIAEQHAAAPLSQANFEATALVGARAITSCTDDNLTDGRRPSWDLLEGRQRAQVNGAVVGLVRPSPAYAHCRSVASSASSSSSIVHASANVPLANAPVAPLPPVATASRVANGCVGSPPPPPPPSARQTASLRESAAFSPLSLGRERANSAAYLRNLRLQRGSLTYRGAMLNITRYRLKASSCPNIYRKSMATINESNPSSCDFLDDFKDVLCDMMDVRLLTNFRYALFCLSNFLLNACVDNPYVYIPDHAASLPSIEEGSGAFLISIVGVLNTLGVVIVGYIGDKPWIDPSLLYALCTIVAGASVAAIPLLRSYLPLAVASAVYGFAISANYTLVPEIVVNLISLESFTAAYGLLLLIQGVAGLIGPPIAGQLYDISGSYDATFYISGLSILASGLIVIPIAQTWKCFCGSDHNNKDREEKAEVVYESNDCRQLSIEPDKEQSRFQNVSYAENQTADGVCMSTELEGAEQNSRAQRSPTWKSIAQVRFSLENRANVNGQGGRLLQPGPTSCHLFT